MRKMRLTLSKSEVQLLRELAKEDSAVSVSELGKRIGRTHSLITLLWMRLQSKGFVTTTRMGMTKTVKLNDAKHSILLRNLLVQSPNIPWEDLLATSHLPMVFALLKEVKFQEIRERTQVSRTTLWRRLRKLMEHGLVIEEDGTYSINPRWQTFAEFLREYASYTLLLIAQEASMHSVILWNSYSEFLMRVPTGTKIERANFHVTATSKLHEYSLSLLSNYDYYFYSTEKKELRVEDVALHLLLIEVSSLRYILYSLLLMKKRRRELDNDYLLAEAEKFNLRRQVEGMLEFLDEGKTEPDVSLPSKEEFLSRAKEYGVI